MKQHNSTGISREFFVLLISEYPSKCTFAEKMKEEKEPTEKQIQEIKSNLEKQHGREFSEDEARHALWDLRRLARIMYDAFNIESKRKELLIQNPKGFHLESGGTCAVCSNHVSGENSWYDKHGVKCMPCQRAINEKIIPASLVGEKDNWYSKHEMESYFNIKGADLSKYIKQSVLKDRVIKGETKKIHLQLFLMKDNKGVLPPKKLLKSRIVNIIHKGEEYITTEEWYEYADEKLIKRLAKYRIIECLKETLQKPITGGGRLLVPKKGVNPLFTLKDNV
jgi:hypothetical protein